jgi:tol-pal system protein YbgF
MRKTDIRPKWLVIGLALCLGVTLVTPPVNAQSDNVQELINRIDRLQRELITLQRAVYQGKAAPARSAAPAGQTAAAPAKGLDRRFATRVEIRLTELETEIRKLTGRAEELQHSVGQLESKFTTFASDIELRLRTLEQGAPAGASEASRHPSSASAAPPPPTATRAPRRNAAPNAPPQSLGTVPRRSDGRAARATPPTATPPALPKTTPEEQYNHATSLLLNDEDFSGAERAFQNFIKQHPKHELAGNAHYWLGETYYVRKDFRQAAFTFADGYQRFPKSNKAPDNLLKLGMALGQLGKEKEACTAFRSLLTNFPNLGQRLNQRIQRQRQRYRCR